MRRNWTSEPICRWRRSLFDVKGLQICCSGRLFPQTDFVHFHPPLLDDSVANDKRIRQLLVSAVSALYCR
jgi:hypothetical protein